MLSGEPGMGNTDPVVLIHVEIPICGSVDKGAGGTLYLAVTFASASGIWPFSPTAFTQGTEELYSVAVWYTVLQNFSPEMLSLSDSRTVMGKSNTCMMLKS